MPELRTRTPNEAAATKPNYASGDPAAITAQKQVLARADFAQENEATPVVTSIDGTTIRADVDAAMVAQGATACNNAGARAAIAATITDVLLRTHTTQVVASAATIPQAT